VRVRKCSRLSARSLFAVDRLVLVAGLTAIGDREHIDEYVRRNRDDRQEFVNQVNARMLACSIPMRATR
jgi:histidinol-phosphate/aromatic aminotransferase/cobyric acid decarboxylase-like protein